MLFYITSPDLANQSGKCINVHYPQYVLQPKELSKEIARYTGKAKASDKGRQCWPLVKSVTIKVPGNARELLQHVALVDLPGTGDCNKSRAEMWKKVKQVMKSNHVMNE